MQFSPHGTTYVLLENTIVPLSEVLKLQWYVISN